MTPGKPKDTDDYLAGLPADQRQALEDLRGIVRAALPDAEETIAYSRPAFRLRGRILLAYGASAKHCALYPWDPEIIERLGSELAAYSTSKGTIRFQPEAPLADELVRRIAIARAEMLGS